MPGDDRTALTERLRRLAAAGGDGGARRIRAADSGALLAAILFEADTVVMPRQLRIAGAGPALVLEVASRRVLRALPEGGAALAPDPGDAASLEGLRDMLAAALGAAAEAQVTHLPLWREVDPTEPGVSVAALAESWGLALTGGRDGSEAEVLDRFLSAAGAALPAWLMLSGQVRESLGDDDLLDGLAALGESPLAAALMARRGAWRFAAVGPYTEEAPHRAIGALGELLFVMAIAPGKLAEVADHWRRALA